MGRWRVWALAGSVCAAAAAACATAQSTEDAGVDSGFDATHSDGSPTQDAHTDSSKGPDGGCTGGTVACDGGCFDLMTDPNHCGTCTNVCSTADAGNPGDAGVITATCTGGTCGVACDGGLTQCGAQCFDLNNDPNHCGGCTTSCDGGACCSTMCTDTTSDNANCGSCGYACDGGTTCSSSICSVPTTYKVGNYTLFTGKSSHSPNYLLGSQLTLTKAATLEEFGVISVASGPHVTMALYTDKGGAPDTLVAYTASTSLTGADQQIAPNTNASLSATSYWIMAVYDTTASIGIDYSVTTAQYDYISFTYGSTLPATFPAPLTQTGQRYNYYLVVK